MGKKVNTKPATSANALDWENASGGEWEDVSTGFAPLWKPESNDVVFITPVSVHPFKSKKAKKDAKKKEAGKINYAVEAIYKGGSAEHFYKGSGASSQQVDIKLGDIVAIGTSYNLMGEDKLAVEVREGEARLSAMSVLIGENQQAFRISFNGKVKIGGGRSVNNFSVQVPKGFREKLVLGQNPTKKSRGSAKVGTL
jgi:hypothetical protein